MIDAVAGTKRAMAIVAAANVRPANTSSTPHPHSGGSAIRTQVSGLLHGLQDLEVIKADVEGWAGVVIGAVAVRVGFVPTPIGMGISKGAGVLSIALGAGAVLDGCVAY